MHAFTLAPLAAFIAMATAQTVVEYSMNSDCSDAISVTLEGCFNIPLGYPYFMMTEGGSDGVTVFLGQGCDSGDADGVTHIGECDGIVDVGGGSSVEVSTIAPS